jgi:hypothetical protein
MNISIRVQSTSRNTFVRSVYSTQACAETLTKLVWGKCLTILVTKRWPQLMRALWQWAPCRNLWSWYVALNVCHFRCNILTSKLILRCRFVDVDAVATSCAFSFEKRSSRVVHRATSLRSMTPSPSPPMALNSGKHRMSKQHFSCEKCHLRLSCAGCEGIANRRTLGNQSLGDKSIKLRAQKHLSCLWIMWECFAMRAIM